MILGKNMTFREIQKINSIIDSPSRKSKMFAQTLDVLDKFRDKNGKKIYNNDLDIFGLGNIPHRRVNHDPVTASIAVLQEFGPRGLLAMQLHLIGDAISEQMKKEYGRAGRDLREAQMNFILEAMVRRNKPASFL